MKIVIPDDYQDMVDQLECFSLIRHHDVIRFREPARDLNRLVERLCDADVVISIRERVEFSRALLERLPKLKLIALVGRNSKMIDFAACTELGIAVATGKSNSPVAPAGRGLGMDVLVWGRKSSLEQAAAAGYASAASKEALFERSDVLSLHVRLSRDTCGIVGADDLDRMKPTALIVNTARAELIEPGALLGALRKGRPGYAAVDVYEHEPITNANHPFLSMPNVLCTPHLGWAEWTNFELYFREAFEQIVAYQHGLPMRLGNPGVQPRH